MDIFTQNVQKTVSSGRPDLLYDAWKKGNNDKDKKAFGAEAQKIFNAGINIRDFIPFTEQSLKKLREILNAFDADIDNALCSLEKSEITITEQLKKQIKQNYREHALNMALKYVTTDIIIHQKLVNTLAFLLKEINKETSFPTMQKVRKKIAKPLQGLPEENINALDAKYILNSDPIVPIDTIDEYIAKVHDLNSSSASSDWHPIIKIDYSEEASKQKQFFVAISQLKNGHTYLLVGYQTINKTTGDFKTHILASIGKQSKYGYKNKHLRGLFTMSESCVKDEDIIKTNKQISNRTFDQSTKNSPVEIAYKAYEITAKEYFEFIEQVESGKIPTDDKSGITYYKPIKKEGTNNTKLTLAHTGDLVLPKKQQNQINLKDSKKYSKALSTLNYIWTDCCRGALCLLYLLFNIIDPMLSPHFYKVRLTDTLEYQNGKVLGRKGPDGRLAPLIISARPFVPRKEFTPNSTQHREYEAKCMALQLIWDCMTDIRYTTYDKIIRNNETDLKANNNLNGSKTASFDEYWKDFESLKNRKLKIWDGLYRQIVDDIVKGDSRNLTDLIRDWKNDSQHSNDLKLLTTRRRFGIFPFKTRSARTIKRLEDLETALEEIKQVEAKQSVAKTITNTAIDITNSNNDNNAESGTAMQPVR